MLSRLANFLPQRCCCCLRLQIGWPALCARCYALLPWCKQSQIKVVRAGVLHMYSAFNYQPPISTWIINLKFHHQLAYAELLGELLVRYLLRQGAVRPDVLLPVPLHRKRLSQRGFNQALLITKVLQRRLQIPIDCQLLTRKKATQPQTGLTPVGRRRNLQGAFRLDKPISYQRIAIVDDVITTGATVEALATSLRQTGSELQVYSVARAKVDS